MGCANNAAVYAPWADVMMASDPEWWLQYSEDVADFQGRKYCTGEFTYLGGKPDGVEVLEPKFKARIGSGYICRGGSSGQALISAIIEHHGARDIALIGYDNKGSHCFGDHRGKLGNPKPKNFEVWAQAHEAFAKDARANGIRITNCTRETTLTCYPQMSLWLWLNLGA